MMPMLTISGGQIGADIGGVMGAFAAGYPCQFRTFPGFTPIGRHSLPDLIPTLFYPDLPTSYGKKLATRTKANVRAADATIIFIHQPLSATRGSILTVNTCRKLGRPYLILNLTLATQDALTSELARWLLSHKPTILNAAGQRTCPEDVVAEIVCGALEKLG